MARKEKDIHYIYKTTNLLNSKYYIGMHSTCNLEDGYMGSGKRLRYSIRKHGVENHSKEILEYFITREELVLREIEIVNKELIADDLCMNLKEGGQGGFSSEEHAKKAQISGGKAFVKKLESDLEFFKKHSKISSERINNTHKMGKLKYDNFKGKCHSEESKKLISDSKKGSCNGENNSQYGTCWITKEDVNKKIKKEDFYLYLIEGWIKGRI